VAGTRGEDLQQIDDSPAKRTLDRDLISRGQKWMGSEAKNRPGDDEARDWNKSRIRSDLTVQFPSGYFSEM
jgi:hypothetical protein